MVETAHGTFTNEELKPISFPRERKIHVLEALNRHTEMIGMANADPDERHQIEKSLEYGDAKLKQLHDREKELELLEQDILATRQKLIHRITQLKQQ